MKKINSFYLSTALLALGAITNTASANNYSTAPGVMCGAFYGSQNTLMDTEGRTRRYASAGGTAVRVNCPIVENNGSNGPYRVSVRLHHPTPRATTCRLSTRNSFSSTSIGNTQSRTTNSQAVGYVTLTFTRPASYWDQHSMIRCEIQSGSRLTATKIVNYAWREN